MLDYYSSGQQNSPMEKSMGYMEGDMVTGCEDIVQDGPRAKPDRN